MLLIARTCRPRKSGLGNTATQMAGPTRWENVMHPDPGRVSCPVVRHSDHEMQSHGQWVPAPSLGLGGMISYGVGEPGLRLGSITGRVSDTQHPSQASSSGLVPPVPARTPALKTSVKSSAAQHAGQGRSAEGPCLLGYLTHPGLDTRVLFMNRSSVGCGHPWPPGEGGQKGEASRCRKAPGELDEPPTLGFISESLRQQAGRASL